MATIEDIAALGFAVEQLAWSVPVEADPDNPGVAGNPYTGPAVYSVNGFGVAVTVTADQGDVFDSLADAAAHQERAFQYEQPEAHEARMDLELNGYAVARNSPTEDVFSITGGDVDLTDQLPDDLVSQAGTLPPL